MKTRLPFITPFFLFTLCAAVATNAQIIREHPQATERGNLSSAKCHGIEHAALQAELHPELNTDVWNITLQNMEERDLLSERVREIKNSYPPKVASSNDAPNAERIDATDAIPVIGQHYDANAFDLDYPSDNAMAISNTGWIVTMVNSNIRYYNAAGQLKLTKSFSSFVNDGSLDNFFYDPRVIYDSGSDRFIAIIDAGADYTYAHMLIFFSKTNNPMDGWNYYKIFIGNDASGDWGDFPNVGVSNNEVYVTFNLFNANNNFDQVGLYQIDKLAGYSNATSINYQFWNQINDDQGSSPFTLVPVSYGQTGNYGPGVLLVSCDDGGANKISVYDLTNDMGSSPQLNGYHASITAYNIGSDAVQPSTSDPLDIGDARMRNNAFYLNGTIHCAFNCKYSSNGYNGFNYARIIINPLSATTKKFGTSNTDRVYPSLASFSGSDQDPTVLICYDESGPSVYPSFNAVVCDANMNFGSPIAIKTGNGYIDVDPGNNPQRWGDYTAICRASGASPATPTVWIYGIYGSNNNSHAYMNNLCEIANGYPSGITPAVASANNLDVYPNPVEKYMTVRFETDQQATTSFDLYDAQGKLVHHFLDQQLKDGKYQFGFDCASLPAGLYFINVTAGNKTVAHEKVVVQ